MAFVLSSRWCIFAFWLALLGSLRTTCATRARIQMQCWVWGATASPNLRTQTNRTTRSGHPCQTRNSWGSHNFGSGRTRPGWRRFGTLPIVISHKSSTFSRLFFLGWIASENADLPPNTSGATFGLRCIFFQLSSLMMRFPSGSTPLFAMMQAAQARPRADAFTLQLDISPFLADFFHQVWPLTKSCLKFYFFLPDREVLLNCNLEALSVVKCKEKKIETVTRPDISP